MSYAEDPWYIDLNAYLAHSNVNWDSWLSSNYNGSAGPYMYGAFSTSALGTAAQWSSRTWWRDFGSGGLWDIQAIHVTGNDVGIYSFRMDGVELSRLNGYSGPDINNQLFQVATGLRLTGRHAFSIAMVDTDPSTIGLRYYPAIQGVQFRRTASIPAPAVFGTPKPAQAFASRAITLLPLFASGNTNWDNLLQAPSPGGLVPLGMLDVYECYSSGAQNASRYWDLEIPAGQWDLEISYSKSTSWGIINIQIDGVTQATVDGYASVLSFGNLSTVRLSIPTSGAHRLTLLMATKNASSSNYLGDVSGLQLRQVSALKPTKQTFSPKIVGLTTYWSHGNTNWNTYFGDTPNTVYVYGADIESNGTVNNARWWYLGLGPGTWTFEMLHTTGNNRGIYSVQLDDTQVGTIDGYTSSVAHNVRSSVTGISIAHGGKHKLNLVMATKNASSSNYFGTATALQMRRTA